MNRTNWRLIWFSGASGDVGCLNKRAEMIKDVRDWLKQGGSIENDPIIITELNAIETVPRADGKIQIESKQQIKKRIGISTNRLDGLALTFAHNVVPDSAYGGNEAVVVNNYKIGD